MDTRTRSALLLYAYALLGIFLLVAPWTPVWGQAIHALLPDAIERWMLSGWVRGVVSGLGALDLFVALQFGSELTVRIREDRGAGDPP